MLSFYARFRYLIRSFYQFKINYILYRRYVKEIHEMTENEIDNIRKGFF